jgi:hypothetical protein
MHERPQPWSKALVRDVRSPLSATCSRYALQATTGNMSLTSTRLRRGRAALNGLKRLRRTTAVRWASDVGGGA